MLIQKLRLQRGWSQEQLADISGLSARTIQRIERGQAASLDSRNALAAAFNVDLSELQENDMSNATTESISNEELLALARVRRIKGFYIHLAQFAATTAVLLAINLAWYPRHLWALWVFAFWGSGVLLHGLKVFDRVPFLTADWERRQVEQMLGRKL